MKVRGNSSLEQRRHRYHRGVVNRRWVTFLTAQVVRDRSINMQVSVALSTTPLGIYIKHSLPTKSTVMRAFPRGEASKWFVVCTLTSGN